MGTYSEPVGTYINFSSHALSEALRAQRTPAVRVEPPCRAAMPSSGLRGSVSQGRLEVHVTPWRLGHRHAVAVHDDQKLGAQQRVLRARTPIYLAVPSTAIAQLVPPAEQHVDEPGDAGDVPERRAHLDCLRLPVHARVDVARESPAYTPSPATAFAPLSAQTVPGPPPPPRSRRRSAWPTCNTISIQNS